MLIFIICHICTNYTICIKVHRYHIFFFHASINGHLRLFCNLAIWMLPWVCRYLCCILTSAEWWSWLIQ
jgi:hypothetical protein